MKLLLFLIFSLAGAPLPAQTPKLDPALLKSLGQPPTVVPPKFVPKSAGPVVEKSRSYAFASKGTTTKAARVITMSDGTKTESPLVEIPLLFLRNSTALADRQSVENLRAIADHLKRLSSAARFTIEGHASIDGNDAVNQDLSERRASQIQRELISMGVSSAMLAPPIGRGSRDATQPASATEAARSQDRRVLIVREK